METKSQENNAKHSKDFEVQDQAQSSKDDGELKLHCSCTVASISPNSKAVKSGARIALQPLYQKLVWLGCAGNLCGKASCPRLFMEGRDWYTCWGEVFEIYRLNGEGPVKVGDLVGFNYPRERGKWFALSGGRGHKEGCPGVPNIKYGFHSRHAWNACWGEVFQIYAKGKNIGDSIQNHDAITVYYVRGKKWVGLVGSHPDLRTCPGTTRPPPPDRYDRCWGEIFELWLQD